MGLLSDIRDAAALYRAYRALPADAFDDTQPHASSTFWVDGAGRIEPLANKAYSGLSYGAFARGIPNDLPRDKTGYALAYVQSEYTFRCVNAIAADIARIPKTVVRKTGGEPANDHPLMKALASARKQYRQNLISRWVKALHIYGEAYIEPTKAFPNVPMYVGVRWLNNLAMEPYIANGTLLGFDYWGDSAGATHRFAPGELVYDILENMLDDLRGQSLLDVALNSTNIDRDIVRYTKSWFLNDTRPGGILTGRQGSSIQEAEGKSWLEMLKAQLQGPGKRNRMIYLPQALEYTQVEQGISTEHLQIEESVRRRICMALNIPISVAGAWDDARYQSAPEQRRAYYEGTIMTGDERLVSVMNEELLPFYDKSGQHEVKSDYTKLLALIEDTKQKAELWGMHLERGAVTINQYLEANNIPKIANGDLHVFQSGTVLVPQDQLAQANEIIQGTIAPATQINMNGALPTAPSQPVLPAPVETPLLTANTIIKPVGKAASEGTPAAYAILCMYHDPALIAIQDMLKTMLPDEDGVRWAMQDSFHVTLWYAEFMSDDQLAKAIEGAKPPANLMLKAGPISTFDTSYDGKVLILPVEATDELKAFQASLVEKLEAMSVPISEYSQPARWQPHITLAYLTGEIDVPDLPDVVTVQPQALDFSRTGYTNVSRLPIEQKGQASAEAELKAWEKVTFANRRKGEVFVTHKLPPALATSIRDQLIALPYEATAEATKAVFTQAHVKLGEHKSIENYRMAVRRAIRGLWAGQYSRFDFVDNMFDAIRRYFNEAYLDGARSVGYAPDDLTDEELRVPQSEANAELAYVMTFARDIEDASRANGGALTPLIDRADNWTRAYERIADMARQSIGGDQKLKWVRGNSEQSCKDCIRLDGRIYRASVWKAYDLAPKSSRLACTSHGCNCSFQVTTDPVTRGRPPNIG